MRTIPYSRHMARALIVALVAGCACVVACGNVEGQHQPDAQRGIDGGSDPLGSGSGSGSDEMAMMQSPHDRGLEVVVIASSLVIAVGPVIGSRRRRTPNTL